MKKLRALDRQREQGLNVHQGHQTVENLLKYWLDEYVEPTAKARTTAGHRYTCKQYITPYLGRIRIEKLTVVHVQRWLNTLREQGLSEWIVKAAFIRLKTALNIAVKARMLAELAAGVHLVDVSKILGHSSPEITARIYAHSFATNRRRAIEAVTQLLEKEGQE